MIAVTFYRRDLTADPRGHETWSVVFPFEGGVWAAHCVCGWHSDPTPDGFKMLADRYDHLIATGTYQP